MPNQESPISDFFFCFLPLIYLSSELSEHKQCILIWNFYFQKPPKIMDDQLILNIVLMVLVVVMIFISLVLICCQKFSLKVNIGLLLTPICCMILLLIFYRSQFEVKYGSFPWSEINHKADFILLSFSVLFALVLILVGGLMMYCQRVQNEANIEAENQISVSNTLLQNSKGTVYISGQ